jgi:hypothetical protein
MTQDRTALADRLKAFIRTHAPGGCKMFSLGASCECPLCDVDALFALSRTREETAAEHEEGR